MNLDASASSNSNDMVITSSSNPSCTGAGASNAHLAEPVEQPLMTRSSYKYIMLSSHTDKKRKQKDDVADDNMDDSTCTVFNAQFLRNVSTAKRVCRNAVVGGPIPADSWLSARLDPDPNHMNNSFAEANELLSNTIFCSICSMVCHNPVMAGEECAMHYFCLHCMQAMHNHAWREGRLVQKCPYCSKPASEQASFNEGNGDWPTNKRKQGALAMVKNIISLARFKCDSCEEYDLNYEQSLQHVLTKCKNAEVLCPNGCRDDLGVRQTRVRRGDLQEHLKHECDNQDFACGLCKKKLTRSELWKHFTENCPKRKTITLQCNFGPECSCTNNTLPTGDIDGHVYYGFVVPGLLEKNRVPQYANELGPLRISCKYTEVKCKVPGCDFYAPMHAMKKHNKERKGEHIRLMQEKIIAQETMISATKRMVGEMQTKTTPEDFCLDLQRTNKEKIDACRQRFEQKKVSPSKCSCDMVFCFSHRYLTITDQDRRRDTESM